MSELRFLNLFNFFCVSPTYLERDGETNYYVCRLRHACSNALVLVLIFLIYSVATIWKTLQDYYFMGETVMGLATVILYTSRILVMGPLIAWTIVNKQSLLDLFNRVLLMEKAIQQLRRDGSSTLDLGGLRSLRLEVALIVALLGLTWSVDFYLAWTFGSLLEIVLHIVSFGFPFLEFISSLHRAYTEILVVFISGQLEALHQCIVNEENLNTIRKAMELLNELEQCKLRIASTMGLPHVFYLLDVLVKCSVRAYLIFYLIDLGSDDLTIPITVAMLALNGSSFYLYTYRYNMVQDKVGRCCLVLINTYVVLQKSRVDQREL
uniref:Gustatory receptor n=1 Tax=Anopheles darlingi TaxID=43151 RepID=A0A2M4CJP7_ANODA